MKLLFRIGLLLTVVFVAPWAVAGTAQARPAEGVRSVVVASCVAGSCTGKDPSATGCSADAVTAGSFTMGMGENANPTATVALRHSYACRAKWVRVTAPMGRNGCGGGENVRIRIRNLNSAGTALATYIRAFGACEVVNGNWTPMVGRVSGSYRTEYCFRLLYPDGSLATPYTCKSVLWG